MAKYIVKSTIKHDGQVYAPGSVVELTGEQAIQAAHALEGLAKPAAENKGKD
jgi:hypothetical protein